MERSHLKLDVGVPCLCLWKGVGTDATWSQSQGQGRQQPQLGDESFQKKSEGLLKMQSQGQEHPVALGRGPAGRCEGLEGGEENLGSGGWAGAERDTGLF